MRKTGNEKELTSLLEPGRIVTVADFMAACPEVPQATVYSRIRALVQEGELSQIGRGRYVAVCKPKYVVPVSPWMIHVNDELLDSCEGIDHCIYEQAQNLIVEVPRGDLVRVVESMKKKFPKVVLQKDAARFPALLEGYIVVGTLVSDAPLAEADGLRVPSLEKALIDGLCRNREERRSVQLEFQKALDAYPVNLNRLHRYAARRGATEELSSCLSAIDVERSEMFTRIQRYFSGIPVARAWVFGSFARGEETEASDLDLLVDYLPESRVSLLDIIRQRLDLEKIAGRAVDLVENGNLRPFAAESAERDKYLIYERKTERRSPA